MVNGGGEVRVSSRRLRNTVCRDQEPPGDADAKRCDRPPPPKLPQSRLKINIFPKTYQEQLQQQHSQQHSRKRKTSSSGAVNSTGTGLTIGQVDSPPSTHMPGDGSQLASNKGLMICGTEGNGGLVSSTNQMDTFENYGDIGSLDDNVESFLSNDDGDGRDIFASLKRSPDQNTDSLRDILNEIACIRITNNKVGCCHFSSDGKLLASAGHERKVKLHSIGNIFF